MRAVLDTNVLISGIFFDGPEPVCDDPDDDKFFACAVASGVFMIISGDAHLLTRSGYRNITVLRPAEFVEQHPELF